ncbi:hypothetical protein P153DRAFT_391562 [Dothidotthia symphoricarpi CBS 119687]|uniref:Rhodopsin domain-containing protein n=1 Tax=Dothidotthia symphoricarpi CBS 119687 TaxID=1392245 RepID=A0A6A5ZUZ7_9PLEO|nr:uncharacterized protein P153DRAFT_391562 [Dothidotthia symphoricarpi CBS 119687]KAF2123470.1 hypothetical protein P153DRAFT_391562 [Dothidotthia symphoricarpi CBS 119687]
MGHSPGNVQRSGRQLEKMTFAFLVLTWIFILLRVWTRTRIISSFGWDDSTMLLAAITFTVFCSSQLYIEANGGGTHITNIHHLQMLVRWVVVSEASYCATMMILKISLGLFFKRIVAKRWQLNMIYVTVGINICSSTTAFFYVIFRCGSDINVYIIRQLSDQCASKKLDTFMAYQQASITTITDLVFVLLPITLLWNANMHKRSKISVGVILSLGALGCICSMIRFKYVDKLTQFDDFFWNVVSISTWSTIEAGIGIIAGCLATLRPFVRNMAAKARTSSSPLYSCLQKITSSFSSSSKSTSRHGELPRFNTVASGNRDSDTKQSSKNTNAKGNELNYIEFPTPHSEMIAMSSDVGRMRESTDCILQRDEGPAIQYPQRASSMPFKQRPG